ncbi:MAG TPA: trypsin-like peptidase domain-containing protein [Coleofasciculaceae cyanobacterium]
MLSLPEILHPEGVAERTKFCTRNWSNIMVEGSREGSKALLALSNDFADLVERSAPVIVAVNGKRRSAASGVHWRSGILVTADHAIQREEEITVTLPDDRTANATLVGRDGGTDLAVLRLEGIDLPTAEIADPASLKVGHWVMAIARSEDSGVNASLGVLSAVGGAWRTWHGGQIDQFIRPDLKLYSGFSGSALVDVQGRLIGINTAGYRQMALTIPACTVDRLVNQILNRGRVTRGYLGVGMQPVQLSDRLKTALNLPGGGVMIVSLEAGSPAEQAGILMGDILVALGDQPIGDLGDVQMMLDPDRVGHSLTAKLVRGGAFTEVTITIGERPSRGGC